MAHVILLYLGNIPDSWNPLQERFINVSRPASPGTKLGFT